MSAKLRLISIRLRAETYYGLMGRNLDFSDGLNLIRADNSKGKSTALNGIIFALGLEGMLSSSHRIPLAYAMTDTILIDGKEEEVVQSHVSLIVENSSGRRIRITRYSKHPQRKTNLITVEEAGASGGFDTPRDYFVRRKGAAQNDAGFHRYFADFLGLDLPRVTKNDGTESLLYLETLFPYSFVEQKRGWSGIQARMPVYLGIRDVGKRSTEFILGLDSLYKLLDQQRVRSRLNQLEANWQNKLGKLAEFSGTGRIILENLPTRVSEEVQTTDISPLTVVNEEWVEISMAIDAFQSELLELHRQGIPKVGDSSVELESELAQLESALQESLSVSAAIRNKKYQQEQLRKQVAMRIEALQDDLQRHKDVQVLERLGSEYSPSLLSKKLCPTCHQEVTDGIDISSHAMTSEQSIDFIQKQLDTFKSILNDHDRVISAIGARETGLTARIRDSRGEIRALRETLQAANSDPSVASIEHRIRIENLIAELQDIQRRINSARDEIVEAQQQWQAEHTVLMKLNTNVRSRHDEGVIQSIQESVRKQLESYGFSSLDPKLIEIDSNSYRPVYEGFDLGFELSASDMVRLIWAYLFAFLQVGQNPGGRHFGLLILDEPRQQETDKNSFSALLHHASLEGSSGAQVIFATSEPYESLQSMLNKSDANIINLAPGERLLRPIIYPE